MQEILPIPIILNNEIEQIKRKYYENDKFIFSIFLNISAKIFFVSDIILVISESAGDFTPKDFKKLCETIKLRVSNKKKSNVVKSEKNSQHEYYLNQLNEAPNEVTFDMISPMFFHLFPLTSDLNNLRSFYSSLKKERVMSFFLNEDAINQFFKSIHHRYEKDSQKILEFFEELKIKAYEIQKKKIQQIFEYFIQIFHHLSNYKESVKDLGINFSKIKETPIERLNSFILKTNKKQIEKIRNLTKVSSESDEDMENVEHSLKKFDTLEQIAIKDNYKPSYYLNLEGETKEEELKSDSEIFELSRKNIKYEISERNKVKTEQKKEEVQPRRSLKSQMHQNDYLREMLKITFQKNEIEKS